MLREMIESCINQTYNNFELCLADASDEKHGYVFEIASEYAKRDKRVKVERLKENLGISGNTNACRKSHSICTTTTEKQKRTHKQEWSVRLLFI